MIRPLLSRGLAGGVLITAVAISAEGCEESCDPVAFLWTACSDDEESCNAETRVCESMPPCETADDCPGGYVCYDTGRCALSCNGGFGNFSFDYCKPGWHCADDWTCTPPPDVVVELCHSGCARTAAACGEPQSTHEARCRDACFSHWVNWLRRDGCGGLDDYAQCLAEASLTVDCTVLTSDPYADNEWWRASWWALEPFKSTCPAPEAVIPGIDIDVCP